MKTRPLVGITAGDPSGIGPEITRRALGSLDREKRGRVVVFGDKNIFGAARAESPGDGPLLVSPGFTRQGGFPAGVVNAPAGRASWEYLRLAVDWLRAGRLKALVTAPVSKEAINLAGIPFSGHTGFLADSFGVADHAMLFSGGRFRLLLLTTHLPLRDVPGAIDRETVRRRVALAADFLNRKMSVADPLILVCGLNPHAGEGGLLGDEECRVIIPAIGLLRSEGRTVAGPVPADSAWLEFRKRHAHLVVSAYHDQLLPVFKAFYFERGVNLTVGLPFVRTSPAHGTAFDLAGAGRAASGGMEKALAMAFRLCR